MYKLLGNNLLLTMPGFFYLNFVIFNRGEGKKLYLISPFTEQLTLKSAQILFSIIDLLYLKNIGTLK